MMTLILIGIGALFALIFHVGTKEPSCKKTRELATRVADSAETGMPLQFTSIYTRYIMSTS